VRYAQGQNIDEPLAMLRSSATSFFNADGLGSVSSLTNTTASLAQTYTYDSFGKLTSSSGSLTNPFQYTGRELDSETGLYFYRARYYDSNSGRFLGEDPIRFDGGINFYVYAKNNPANFEDGTGLCPAPPKCFAQLKYRSTEPTNPKNTMTHSFWYVQGSDGNQFIISGGPSKPTGGSLNVGKIPASKGNPELSAPIWWNSGFSSAICADVDAMLMAADAWPQNKIPYDWQGPNSNSVSKYFGSVGGFFPTAPPGSTGWKVPVRP
jgi:RHS repeat-associated protein